MFIIVLFASAGVLFDGTFSVRVSLTFFSIFILKLVSTWFYTKKSNSKIEFVNVFY